MTWKMILGLDGPRPVKGAQHAVGQLVESCGENIASIYVWADEYSDQIKVVVIFNEIELKDYRIGDLTEA